MKQVIYESLLAKKRKGLRSFAVLIDPDNVNGTKIDELTTLAVDARVDYLLVGGSLVISNHLDEVVQHIRKNCSIPVILFPGTPSQVSRYADGLLYLSLISGRNPELLIGQHVISAPKPQLLSRQVFVSRPRVSRGGRGVFSPGLLGVRGGGPAPGMVFHNS